MTARAAQSSSTPRTFKKIGIEETEDLWSVGMQSMPSWLQARQTGSAIVCEEKGSVMEALGKLVVHDEKKKKKKEEVGFLPHFPNLSCPFIFYFLFFFPKNLLKFMMKQVLQLLEAYPYLLLNSDREYSFPI